MKTFLLFIVVAVAAFGQEWRWWSYSGAPVQLQLTDPADIVIGDTLRLTHSACTVIDIRGRMISLVCGGDLNEPAKMFPTQRRPEWSLYSPFQIGPPERFIKIPLPGAVRRYPWEQ